MVDETKTEKNVDVAIETAVAPVKAVAATVEAVVAKTKPVAKKIARRAPKAAAKVQAVKQVSKRAAKKVKRVRKAAPAARTNKIEGMKTMNYDFNQLFAGFQIPGADKAQDLIAEANDRGQQFAAKSQKTVEQFAELAKANVEAIVEAGRIYAGGAKAIGQDAIASGRQRIEQASDAVKTLAEAKSPAEFFQIQSELARASFDRFVAETSKLTERAVKLAGETVEPLQTRASLNAERINTLVA